MQLIATFDSSLSNGNGGVDVDIYIFNISLICLYTYHRYEENVLPGGFAYHTGQTSTRLLSSLSSLSGVLDWRLKVPHAACVCTIYLYYIGSFFGHMKMGKYSKSIDIQMPSMEYFGNGINYC